MFMKRGACENMAWRFIVAIVFMLAGHLLPIYAQDGLEFLNAAEMAVREGKYPVSKEQLEAYRAYLIAISGKSESSPEVLKVDKRINKVSSAISALQKADALMKSLDSGASEYRSMITKPSELIVSRLKYDSAQKKYNSLSSLSASVTELYSQVLSDFPSDRSSSAKLREASSFFNRIQSPSSVIKRELLRAPSEGNLNNYIAFCGISEKNARILRDDFNSWKACRGGELSNCDRYLSNSSNKLFRDEVKKIREELVHDGLVKFDDNLWANTDKQSKQSLNAYILAENNGVKNHSADAERLIAGIEEYERARAEEASAYEALDKASSDAIRSYLHAHPQTVYSDELYRDLDEAVWASTDKADEESLMAYINSSELKSRSHEKAAYSLWNAVRGRKYASQKNWELAAGAFESAEYFAERAEIEVLTEADKKLYAKALSKVEGAKAKAARAEKRAGAAVNARSFFSGLAYNDRETGYPIQLLVGMRYDCMIVDSEYETYMDAYGQEQQLGAVNALTLNAGLKFGRNDKLVNVEANCDFGFNFTPQDATISGIRKIEIYPNAMLKFNLFRDPGFAVTTGIGGGYKIYARQPCVHGTLGISGSKWYNFYGILSMPVVAPIHTCLGLGFNIYFL